MIEMISRNIEPSTQQQTKNNASDSSGTSKYMLLESQIQLRSGWDSWQRMSTGSTL